MKCTRCKGQMSYEHFQDLEDDTGHFDFEGWRCMSCGEILDPGIYFNRKSHPLPQFSRSHKKVVAIFARTAKAA